MEWSRFLRKENDKSKSVNKISTTTHVQTDENKTERSVRFHLITEMDVLLLQLNLHTFLTILHATRLQSKSNTRIVISKTLSPIK